MACFCDHVITLTIYRKDNLHNNTRRDIFFSYSAKNKLKYCSFTFTFFLMSFHPMLTWHECSTLPPVAKVSASESILRTAEQLGRDNAGFFDRYDTCPYRAEKFRTKGYISWFLNDAIKAISIRFFHTGPMSFL